MSQNIKISTLIGRIMEDYSNSITVSVTSEKNFVKLKFGFAENEVIEYKIRRDFFDKNLRNIFQADIKRDFLLGVESKNTEEL